MVFQEYLPSPALQPYIAKYYFIEISGKEGKDFVLRIPPTGNVYINFFFGELWRFFSAGQRLPTGRIMINGQICEHSMTGYLNGYSNSIGIEFYPLGAARLLGLPLSKITNHTDSLPHVLDQNTDNVYLQARNKETTIERLAVIEDWLMQFLPGNAEIPDYLHKTEQLINVNNGNTPICEIAETLNLSTRCIEKKFNYYIGLTPKYYAQVKRVNHIIKLSKYMNKPDWQLLLEEGAFYDQSHFIKVFQSVVNCTPTEYLNSKNFLQDQFIGR